MYEPKKKKTMHSVLVKSRNETSTKYHTLVFVAPAPFYHEARHHLELSFKSFPDHLFCLCLDLGLPSLYN